MLLNCRPVTNLILTSTLIEKYACNQLHKYILYDNLRAKFQSVSRVGHSTDIEILLLHNDVMCSLDARRDAIPIMLHLSAAFDTIDHDILLHRIHTKFGVNGTAQK